MGKIPKGYIEGALCYITTRGDHEEKIFIDNKDYLAYMGLLKRYKKQYGFKLFAFTLLPNHLHLLIELSKTATTSQITHDINSNYTKHFNTRHDRKGHLFQERSKMVILEKEAYLLPVMTYAHLNPIQLKLVKDLNEYKYSSHTLYIKGSQAAPGNEITEGLDMNEELRQVGQSYAEYFTKVNPDKMKSLGRDLSKEAIMGTEEFRSSIIRKTRDIKQSSTKNVRHYNKKMVFASALVIVVLGAAIFYLYQNTVFLKNLFRGELAKKDAEIDVKIAQEKTRIYKDLDEKYRADIVSYHAMGKRLEIEKQKQEQLEKQAGNK